ncbi:MAG: microcompartment protein PduB [Lachnospiraceae bacterium]|jgi:microcompartment protein PduB
MEFNFNSRGSDIQEFVGTAALDTIGLVISGLSDQLREKMDPESKYYAIGVFSSRTGAVGQITAVDDAVKATNTEVLSVELPRDSKGGAGHGNYIVVGGHDVSDVRQCIAMALELTDKYVGELYTNEAGHLEFAYSANADQAINKAFGIPMGEAFGFMAGAPAAIGMVMADYAVKAANVEIASYMTPSKGTSHTNEVIIAFYGDAAAVKTAVKAGREVGLSLLSAMGSTPASVAVPYIE